MPGQKGRTRASVYGEPVHTISIVMPESVEQAVRAWAQSDRRTISQLVVVVMEKALREREGVAA